MKKKVFFLTTVASFLMVGALVGCLVPQIGDNKLNVFNAEDSTYTLSLGADEFASLSESYTRISQLNVSSATSGSYKFTFNVENGKKVGSDLVLAKLGKVFNFSSSAANDYGAIKDIKSIKVTFSAGDLNVKMATRKDGLELGPAVALTSASELNVADQHANYFCLESGASGATISNIEVKYSCGPVSDFNMKQFDQTIYTGKTSEGYIYNLKVSGNNVQFNEQNTAAKNSFSGTASIVDNKVVAVLSVMTYQATITFNPTANLEKLAFVSVTDNAGGAVASQIPHVDLYKAYVVENFEQYSATGTGYTSSNSEFNRSGLQGGYFADYYSGGSGSSPVGTNGFSLMGSTDWLQLDTTTGGIEGAGSKSAKFKASQGKWMRYWQYDQLVGEPYTVGVGSVMSMWVKNTASVAVKMKWGAMKTYAPLNDSNRNTGTFQEVTIPASSGWTEYTIALGADVSVYGWYIAFNNANALAYVNVDMVTVYTVSPFDTTEPPAPVSPYLKTVTIHQNITLTAMAQTLLGKDSVSLYMALGKNGLGKIMLEGKDVTIDGYDVDVDDNVTINTTFSMTVSTSTITLTKITGVFNTAGTQMTSVKLTGDLMDSIIENNGSLVLDEKPGQDSFEGMTTAQLQTAYSRWYNNGSWTKDTGNADRIVADSTNPIHGSTCMTVRGYSKFRVTMAADFETALPLTGIGFWARNNGTKAYTLKLFFYKGAGFTNNVNPLEKTLPADGDWHYYQTGIPTATYYNFSIFFDNSSAVATDKVSLDYLYIY